MMKENRTFGLYHRVFAMVMAVIMLVGMMPGTTIAWAVPASAAVTTVADPDTVSRPADVYGNNTENAGKITVGKSVSDSAVVLSYGDTSATFTPEENQFIVTISQAAQIMGLASETSVPVDVVFVIDTSGSMDDNDRAETLVTAANSAIATLMSTNEQNRVAVVAFSSEGYGDGTSGDAAASVLSSLAHYTGEAATNHLQWVNSEGRATGNNRNYIAGRDTVTIGSGWNTRTVNAFRHGKEGGTNIQAGIVEGAKILTSVTDTTYTDPETEQTLTRIPFLVILSDGQPTFSYDDETWYEPTTTGNNAADEQGPGNGAYEGNGFIAAMTAAYYKGLITEHYYGDKANNDNHCFVYTMGVEIDSLTGDELALARITLNPKDWTVGDNAAEDAASYWNYGNTANDNTRNAVYGWKIYWNNYLTDPAADFGVRVDGGNQGQWVWSGEGEEQEYYEVEEPDEPRRNASQAQWEQYYEDLAEYEAWLEWRDANFTYIAGQHYTFTAESITASRDYVNGVGYSGGIAYNDEYFNAASVSQMEDIFQAMLRTIQEKAMSVPTHVDTAYGEDFSGYVTFTDPIGEYMEVKQMYGVLGDGNYYRGRTFAYHLANWDSAPQEFKDMFTKALTERCRLTGSTIDVEAFVDAVVASPNQAYYKGDDDYDNSIVWWGHSFTAEGEEDVQMQMLGAADNDTIEYIESQKTAGTVPAGADYVCRSYFFYGTAGNTVDSPNHEYMYFMVRVQRSLTAPYQQTVVISAPASLLSVEKVMITESTDADGNITYTAKVTPAEPARVIYEVGLREDINAYNVAEILAEDAAYLGETAEFGEETVHTNYDAATGTYTFYTNDWDRSKAENSHERAMAQATFDAAADNAFYTYQEDTLIYVKSGDSYVPYSGTEKPVGEGFYYARTVYDWDGAALNSDGTYNATVRTVYIPVTLPNSDATKQEDGSWYICAGVYKASSLTGGEDVYKSSNNTQTSEVVAHPHRTVSESNSHYTVFLGNNGKLTLQAEDTKHVEITKADETVITDGDGKVVMVGDTLTYTIDVVNGETTTADATVTDVVPKGTSYVEGSATNGGTYDAATNTITWNLTNIAPGEVVSVSFKVLVTEDALSGEMDVVSIDNAAYVQLSNGFEYETNTTTNPPEGKKAVDSDGNLIDGSVEVPDVLVYRIRYYNDTAGISTVTVTDIIPAGTSYVAGSASHGGVYDAENKTVTWTITGVQPGASGVVSFRVNVNASAVEYIENNATIKVGNNDPRQTNQTTTLVEKGDLILRKTVLAEKYPNALNREFVLNIAEIGQGLNGVYEMTRNGQTVEGGITFTNGVATVTIRHDDEIRIIGIPAGAIISVTEVAQAGYTPAYYVNGGATASVSEGRVTIVEGTQAVSVSVENSYAPAAVSFTLKGVKKLESTTNLGDTAFGFTAYGCDANGTNIDPSKLLTGEVTVSSTTNEAVITFGALSFTEPGDYHYLISEVDGGLTGVDYAKEQYLVTITVTDDGSGTMTASATLKKRANPNESFGTAESYTDAGVTFVNTYAPEPTSITLEGSKNLTGRTLKAGEFAFVVTDASGTVVSTGTNDENGNITFRPITYSAPGTYTYTVTEVNGGLAGVQYSAASYTVVVTVTDQDGTLVATPAYPVGGVVFTNAYTPAGVTVTLEGTKTLTGRSMTAGEFNFIVVDEAGDTVATGTNDENGKISFTSIGYSVEDVGTHTYTVKEVVPDVAVDPNMYYDPTTFTVTVTVSYNEQTGILTASAPVVAEGSIAFTNIQNLGYVEVTPEGTKSTDNAPEGVGFSFHVIDVVTGEVISHGVGDANGGIDFSVLTFTEEGTYKYWIKETNAGNTNNGITYDDGRYLMEVKVTRGEFNKLVAEVSYFSSAVEGSENVDDYTEPVTGVPSFHNEYNAAGYINLIATKKLEGRDLLAGEFAFELCDENGDVVDGVVAADGTITFATLYYTEADLEGKEERIIQYTMKEMIPETAQIPGVTYDSKEYVIFVKITDDGQGNINAVLVKSDGNGGYIDVEGTDTGVTFTNTYSVIEGTSVTIEANKSLDGRDLIPGEFSFQLYHVEGTTETLVASASNGVGGKVTFTRNYPATILDGVDGGKLDILYKIVEVNNRLGGVTYDEKVHYAKVTISDNLDGTMSADVAYYSDAACTKEVESGDVKFENGYKASETTYTPVANKVLNREMKDNEFSFVVKSGDTVVSTGVSKADGTVVFTPMGYTTKGTFDYTISEVRGNLTGVVYTSTVYYLRVEVTDDGNGKLVAKGTYYTDSSYTEVAESVVFTNVYTAENVSVQFEATKTLTGRDMTQSEFSFVVKDADGKIVATGGNAAAADGEAAKITFSTIGYKHSDLDGASSVSFIYTISELTGSEGGIVYDTDVFYAKVDVTYNAQTGKLETAVKYYSDAACTQEIGTVAFNNSYEPAPAALVIPADKTLINKTLEAGEFTFVIKNEAGETVQTKTNDANGVVTFDALTFDAEGIYKFTVSEAVSEGRDPARYTLDDSFTVIVTVTDNHRGQLVATAEYFVDYKGDGTDVNLGGVDFINRYTAPGLTLPLNTEIGATKTVNTPEGITYSPAGFQFGVVDVTGKIVQGVDDEGNAVPMIGVSDEQGVITFPNFTFESAGEYHYWIYEMDSDKGGITIDAAVWEVHILVRYNEQTGLLYVNETDVQTYLRGRAASGDSVPVFVNTYEVAPATLTLTASKVLEGRALRDREFLFYLMEGDMIAAQGYSDAEGNVSFTMRYEAVGTHTYTIVEYIPENGLGGVTYDEKVYDAVTVQVRDNGEGQLVAYIDDTALEQGAVFGTGVTITNIYETKPASAVVQAQKLLTGGKLLKGGDYTFKLENNDNPEEVYTAENTVSGAIRFELTFEKAGTYTYTLSEVKGTDSNTTYDPKTYTVTITVTDDLKGQLHAQVSYDTANAGYPVFTNIYTPSPISVVLEGTKKLTGRDLTDGEFTFKVYDANGEEAASGKNDDAGKITFSRIIFSAAGEYTFTVSEVKGSEKGMTYDKTEYTVTVNVTNNDGVLTAEILYPENGVVFENIYKVPVTPNTGDSAPIAMLMVMMSLAAAGFVALLLGKKKFAR